MKFVVASIAFILLSVSAAAETIHFAFSDGYPAPYVMSAEQGIEVEIVRQAFKAVGIELTAEFLSYKRMKTIKSLNIDGYGVTITNENDGLYYSDLYIFFYDSVFTKTSDKIKLTALNDITPYIVGGWQEAPEHLGGKILEYYGNDGPYKDRFVRKVSDFELGMMFWNNQIDVLIQDKLVHNYQTRRIEEKLGHKLSYQEHPILEQSKFYFNAAFKKKAHRDSFNQGLKLIKQNGLYEDIYTKYKKL